MTEQEPNYQAARQRVIRRIRKRLIFAADLLLFVLVLIAHNRPLDVVVVFTPLLLAHFIYAFDIWSNWIERATRREMARTKDTGDVGNNAAEKRVRTKAKRLALSDDGELIGDDEDEEVYYAQERRQ